MSSDMAMIAGICVGVVLAMFGVWIVVSGVLGSIDARRQKRRRRDARVRLLVDHAPAIERLLFELEPRVTKLEHRQAGPVTVRTEPVRFAPPQRPEPRA